MALSPEQRALLTNPRYPRSARYDPAWIVEHQMGSHCLWLAEALSEVMTLTPPMRVLDLGCGKALSSIFLAGEFGVQVWAADLWVRPTENWQRIEAAGVGDRVYPVSAEAHALPFADGFFDAVVSVNTLQFFATAEHYLRDHLARLLRPGAVMGVIVPGLYREWDGAVPENLRAYWQLEFFSWHSPAWWRTHWQRSGLVDVTLADTLDGGEGYDVFRRFERVMHPEGGLLSADAGKNITFVRVVARRK